MKNVMEIFKTYSVYLGIFFLAASIVSCSSDDDGIQPEPDPTGSITAVDQTISGNMIAVQSVTVGQDSWLVATHSENGTTFITDAVSLDEGMTSDIELQLNENANLTEGEEGNEISLRLYDENPETGTTGVAFETETITVFMEDETATAFNEFDTNADGMLDRDEVAGTYVNNFTAWDADDDGFLSEEEFYTTTFANTDADDDDFISEDEWNAGATGMFGNYVGDDDFATWDADEDGSLDANEWNTGFADTEMFTTYDADATGTITETEWNEGLYGDWDMDDDDMINLDEYRAYSPYTSRW